MSEEGNAPQEPTEGTEGAEGDKGKEQTFTQADVDRIVADRLKRERDKYADYDDLKTKATSAETAEERIAELEKQVADASTTALRARIANQYAIPAEDADLFLTGGDEETLTTQAKRLAERTADRNKHGNYVPREGNNPPAKPDERREFANFLTGNTA